MVQKSIYKNAAFNLLRKFAELMFPIVTFAYSCRILGVEGVGQINFAKSIATAFTILATLGINYYGTREGAKLRDDRERLSQYAQEMLMINGCTTALSLVLLFLMTCFVPKFQDYRLLLWINSASIVLHGMGMEWLYQALEEYQYITLRSLAFKVLSLAAMFLFVRTRDDVAVYAIIQVAAISGSYLLNLFNARRYISFKRYPAYHLKRHLKPLLQLFAMAVSIEIYTVLDSTMLGFLQNDAAVGRYTAAIKIERIVNSLVVAAGVVMIPRLSYYIGRREQNKASELIQRIYHYVFMFSIPAAVGLFMLSDEIILLFSGSEFATASVTMRILIPIVILIPFSNTTNQHILIPMGKEKYIIVSTAVGAVTNVICNAILIPRFAENGAAAATVFAESMVALICFRNGWRFFNIKTVFRKTYQYVIAALPIVPLVLLVRHLHLHTVYTILMDIVLSVACYFGLLGLFKNPYLQMVVQKLMQSKVLSKLIAKRRDKGQNPHA